MRVLATALAATALAATTTAYAVAPAVQICNNLSSPQLCFNRQGGGTAYGTFITGYYRGDPNGPYEGVTLTGRCNAGHVSAAQHCPFRNQAYNQLLDNDRIMMVEEYQHDWCAGTSAQGTFTLRLSACPNIDGQGGDWATQYVWNGAGTVFNCLISIEKTNDYGGTSHIYAAQSNGLRGGISLNTGNQDNCSNSALWKEFFS